MLNLEIIKAELDAEAEKLLPQLVEQGDKLSLALAYLVKKELSRK